MITFVSSNSQKSESTTSKIHVKPTSITNQQFISSRLLVTANLSNSISNWSRKIENLLFKFYFIRIYRWPPSLEMETVSFPVCIFPDLETRHRQLGLSVLMALTKTVYLRCSRFVQILQLKGAPTQTRRLWMRYENIQWHQLTVKNDHVYHRECTKNIRR